MGVFSLRSSVSLSVFVHLLFICVCILLAQNRSTQLAPRQMTYIDLEPAPEQAKLAQAQKTRQQIVQTSQVQKSKEAAPDAFLGAQNQVVDRETIGRNKSTQMGKDTTQSAKAEAERKASISRALEMAKRMPLPNLGQLSKFGLPMIPTAKQAQQQQDQDQAQAQDHAYAAPSELPQDYVKGVKEGERTLLNTKEFVFFGYFQRIRERLDRAWVPILREKLVAFYHGGRTLASDMDHTTKVLVVLNPQGEITRVKILSESGTNELDDAAIKAFNKAGPFPNPPKGIADATGEISIPWEFILKT